MAIDNVTPFIPPPIDNVTPLRPKATVHNLTSAGKKLNQQSSAMDAALTAVEGMKVRPEYVFMKRSTYLNNANALLIQALMQLNQIAMTLTLVGDNDLAAMVAQLRDDGNYVHNLINEAVVNPPTPEPQGAA